MEKARQYPAVRRLVSIFLPVVAAAALLAGAFLWLLQPPNEPDGGISVPSGQTITLQEVVEGAPGVDGLTVRYRFIAPEIARDGGDVSHDAALKDMRHLCETYALPRVANTGPQPSQIIVSLADRAVEFGSADPAATQYFEGFSIAGDSCIWEGF